MLDWPIQFAGKGLFFKKTTLFLYILGEQGARRGRWVVLCPLQAPQAHGDGDIANPFLARMEKAG